MEALARIVFERTPQGLMATKVLDDSGVPKRLRTLLLAVDGRTPVAQFVPFLTALAPLSEKFEELERLGLLRRKGQVSAEAVERFSRARENNASAAELPRIDAATASSDYAPLDGRVLHSIQTSFVPAPQQAAPTLDAFSAELQALERMMRNTAPAALGVVAAPAAPVTVAAQPGVTLADVLGEISSFLARTAGLDGLPVALLIGQIQSVEQMRREMSGYSQVVLPYGAPAQAHLKLLEGMLAKAR